MLEIKDKQIQSILGIPYIGESIKNIVENINYVQKNSLFIVRKGNNYDGFKDIEEALLRKAIVVHTNAEEQRGYFVEDLDLKLETLMATFYQGISHHFKLIGVCGTNGKSSVVSYLYDCLKEVKRMKIGTHFIVCDDFVYEQENTTPSKITLMHMIHLAYQHKIQYILMEVSSHAVDQGRISLLSFDYLIYTNIERDHLDYHRSLIHYRYTKYKLCKYTKEQAIVIANKDELYFHELKKVCKRPIISYGMEDAHFQIQDIHLQIHETSFYINRYFFKTNLLGKVNVYNVAAIVVLMRLLSISYYDIYRKTLMLTSLSGRLEVLKNEPYTIIIDYAHTARAFYEVVSFVSALKSHKCIVVVGCGGEREKEKRAEIGYYASYYCDEVIFTEDNSRCENIDDIMNDMCLRVQKEVVKIPIREEAVQYALKIAENNDIILISGKGDETYLIREGKKIPYNDTQTIKMILE